MAISTERLLARACLDNNLLCLFVYGGSKIPYALEASSGVPARDCVSGLPGLNPALRWGG